MTFRYRAAFAAFGSVMAMTASAAQAERPVEAFAQLPVFSDMTISPDGTKMATSMAIDGEQQLVIMPLDGQGEPVVFGSQDGVDVLGVTWVNKDWLAVRVGTEGYVDQWQAYTTRYIAFRADGGKQHLLEPKRDEMIYDGGRIIWTARDGSPEILLAYRTSIYVSDPGSSPKVMRVDVEKNKFSLENAPMERIDTYYADGSGVVRVGVGDAKGGSEMRVVYREDGKQRLHEIASAKLGAFDELIVPRVFLKDGNRALAFASPDGYDAIYEVDLATMELGGKVFGVKGYDLESVMSNRTKDALVGVSYVDSMYRTLWFDPKMQQVQALLDQTFIGKRANVFSSSWDYDRHLVSVGLPSEPSSIYYFDVPNKKLKLLSKPAAGIASGNGAVRSIVYTARDGTPIPAILTTPPGKEAKNLPLIVLPHGGPMVRDYERWDWWTQFLADRGYAVLQPNYRGSTGFGDSFEEMGVGEWGLKMQDDVDDGRAWAVESGLADGDRVCIVGASYGGYVAMRAAQRNPDLYKCSISFAGVSDLPRMMRYDANGFLSHAAMRAYWQERTADLKDVSPISHPEQFGTPILIVHGKEDTRVPIAQSREMAEKLQAAGKNVTYVEQPEGDHHFSRQEDRQQFLELSEQFLDKYNPAS